jgi:hypothetical protein
VHLFHILRLATPDENLPGCRDGGRTPATTSSALEPDARSSSDGRRGRHCDADHQHGGPDQGAALTEASHMPLYVIYPVLIAFCVVFLTAGLRNFRRRVLV